MITAKQAREESYDKVVLWCEKKLQPEIEHAMFKKQNLASKLFADDEANPEEVKTTLEKYGYRVVLTNMTKQAGFKSEYGTIYNVTIYW